MKLPGNMQQMMRQAQQMQEKMAQDIAQIKVTATAGGGMVTVTMSGDLELRAITIDPEAIDPEDAELLQDMVTAAVNEALRSAQELAAKRMSGLTGGMDLGSLGLPGF